MRPYFLNLLNDIAHILFLKPETLFLTINLLDRYCSRVNECASQYRLLGCVAMYIAIKHCQGAPILASRICYICNECYDEKAFTLKEMSMLTSLEIVGATTVFDFLPTVGTFLQLVRHQCPDIKEEEVTSSVQEIVSMARYISEIACFYWSRTRPSIVSRYACYIARWVLHSAPTVLHSTPTVLHRAPKPPPLWTGKLLSHLYSPPAVLRLKYDTLEHSWVAKKLKAYMDSPVMSVMYNTYITLSSSKAEQEGEGEGTEDFYAKYLQGLESKNLIQEGEIERLREQVNALERRN